MGYVVIISTLAMLLGLLITWRVHGQGRFTLVVAAETEHRLGTSPGNLPMLSIIIPARNEAGDIRECIDALLVQTYPNYEIIVVDDRSTDKTLPILVEMSTNNPRLRVIQGTELPPGWAGKPHALVQGVEAATGEWLCFMDADTIAKPELLWSTYHTAELRAADMFSILTRQELGSFWEKAVLPLVFLGLANGFPAEDVNDPYKPDAIANGQFILIKREVYNRAGGHAAVKERIDEDRALAATVKHAGYRLVLADGRLVAHTRMYTSLAEMWEGWTKNIYLGMQGKYGMLLFGAVLGLAVSIVLPAWLVGGLAWLAAGGGGSAAIVSAEAALLWGYLLWERSLSCRYFDISGWYALTFPLGALIFTLMMMASTFDVLSGRGVSWKGRRYK